MCNIIIFYFNICDLIVGFFLSFVYNLIKTCTLDLLHEISDEFCPNYLVQVKRLNNNKTASEFLLLKYVFNSVMYSIYLFPSTLDLTRIKIKN